MPLEALVDGLSANPALPSAMVERLLRYGQGFGRVAGRPDLSAGQVEAILGSTHPWLRRTLALNEHLDAAVRLRLAADDDPAIRRAVAGRAPASARELFERLIRDPAPDVRRELARTDRVPHDLRARLAHEPDPDVRAELAKWWTQAPEPARRTLLTDPENRVRAAASPALPAAEMERILTLAGV
ncbi:hypothetical protein ACPPVO_20740 [Dactylosporangium sp. McL0621]|uniref:hypothetical protein n=1 Tax=Dactylosporangium sp. McL0621 TaxID=3415678 RepID=UPI003CF1D061